MFMKTLIICLTASACLCLAGADVLAVLAFAPFFNGWAILNYKKRGA